MKRTTSLGALAIVTLVAVAGIAATSVETTDVRAEAEQAAQVLQFENLARTVTILQDKFTALAEAMPEDTYDWQPMEGVRSVSDVYIHISADNFFVPSLMGLEAPSGTGITDDVRTFRAYQERDMSKTEALDAVDASFEFLLGSMEGTRDELERSMMLGSSETTVGDVWIRAVVHLHEHLGQSIAYARSNGVVPPWSM